MNDDATPAAVFWGVRGSHPTTGPAFQHGGDTACIELRSAGGQRLIIDAGTGIIRLGRRLTRSSGDSPIDILLSHFHWDHIQGLPFFEPLFRRGASVTFWAPGSPEETRKLLAAQMAAPFFPVPFEDLPATPRCCSLQPDQPIGHFKVRHFALRHPQTAWGYRVDFDGCSVIYATDHEAGEAAVDQRLVEEAQEADLLIGDAHFTPAELEDHRGWGHSSWQQMTRLARRARVARLVLFHHAPGRADSELDAILDEARQDFPDSDLALQGRVFSLGGRNRKD